MSASPIKSTQGLQPNEVTALALVMANVDSSTDGVSVSTIKSDMEKAGYTKLATQLALTRLTRYEMVEPFEMQDGGYGNSYTVYRILTQGEDWLLANQEGLELHMPPKRAKKAVTVMSKSDDPFSGDMGITDDDVTF